MRPATERLVLPSPCSVIPYHPLVEGAAGSFSSKPLTPSTHGRLISQSPSADKGGGSIHLVCRNWAGAILRLAIRGVFLKTNAPHLVDIAWPVEALLLATTPSSYRFALNRYRHWLATAPQHIRTPHLNHLESSILSYH